MNEEIVHLGFANEGSGELRTLCGLTRRRRVLTEVPERVCKTCDRASVKRLGAHRHWMLSQGRYVLRWPHVIWTHGMPVGICCDLMQSTGAFAANTVWRIAS